MTSSSKRDFRLFESLCGKNMMSSVILVTTMWDRVGNEGAERESELSSSNVFLGGGGGV